MAEVAAEDERAVHVPGGTEDLDAFVEKVLDPDFGTRGRDEDGDFPVARGPPSSTSGWRPEALVMQLFRRSWSWTSRTTVRRVARWSG